MKVYSPFFETLYDIPSPVGAAGREVHHTVLRLPVWHGPDLRPLPNPAFHDMAVLWDDDHDERVIAVVEHFWLKSRIAPVWFISERKGVVSLVLDPRSHTGPAPTGALSVFRDFDGGLTLTDNDHWTLDELALYDIETPRFVGKTVGQHQWSELDSIHATWDLGVKSADKVAVGLRRIFEP